MIYDPETGSLVPDLSGNAKICDPETGSFRAVNSEKSGKVVSIQSTISAERDVAYAD
jgi:hypothetical protein